MSITVDGRTYRTLSQPIRLGDGRQVKEVWQDGRKVYPDLPRFAYALKLAGKMNATFMYAREISWRFGGILSGDTFEVMLSPALMATSVEVTVLSDDPIEVYEGGDLWAYPSGSEPSSWYHSGSTLPREVHNGFGWDDPKIPKIVVPDFPKPLAKYAFRCISPCQNSDGDYTTCENHTHVMVKASSTNSASPKAGIVAAAFAYDYFERPMSNIVFNLAQGRGVVRGFHPENGSGLSFRSGVGSGSIRTGEAQCKTDGMSGWSTCGFVQYVALPMTTAGIDVPFRHGVADHLLGYLPLNELIYNNNPPVTAPTFSTCPPTE